jgi:hypothetical protein
VDAHIGINTLVDYGTTAKRIPWIWWVVQLTAAAMQGPYLVGLAQCYHKHLHAARLAELMLSETLHCSRAYRSRDRHPHRRHQVSQMLPHHPLGLSASE